MLVFPGKGDGTFEDLIAIRMDVPPFSLHLTDVDGNARLDVTASSPDGKAVGISVNLGPEGFMPLSLYRVGIAVSSHRVMDMNQDAVPDIVAFGAASVTLRLGSREGQSSEPLLRRGDADETGSLDITDAVRTLNWLFRESTPLSYRDR